MKIKVLAILFAVSCSSTGATIKKDAAVAGQTMADCLKADVGQQIPNLALTVLGLVTQAVAGGQAGWEATVDDIGKQYGPDVEACAVKSIATVFGAAAQMGSGSASTSMSQNAIIAARARDFIKKKGFQYK
jgi:hypothetical protein